jgi:hypothetical protein
MLRANPTKSDLQPREPDEYTVNRSPGGTVFWERMCGAAACVWRRMRCVGRTVSGK